MAFVKMLTYIRLLLMFFIMLFMNIIRIIMGGKFENLMDVTFSFSAELKL